MLSLYDVVSTFQQLPKESILRILNHSPLDQESRKVAETKEFTQFFLTPEDQLVKRAREEGVDEKELTLLDYILNTLNNPESMRSLRDVFASLPDEMLYTIALATLQSDEEALKRLYITSKRIKNFLDKPETLRSLYDFFYSIRIADNELLIENGMIPHKIEYDPPSTFNDLFKVIKFEEPNLERQLYLYFLKDELEKFDKLVRHSLEEGGGGFGFKVIIRILEEGRVDYLASVSKSDLVKLMVITGTQHLATEMVKVFSESDFQEFLFKVCLNIYHPGYYQILDAITDANVELYPLAHVLNNLISNHRSIRTPQEAKRSIERFADIVSIYPNDSYGKEDNFRALVKYFLEVGRPEKARLVI